MRRVLKAGCLLVLLPFVCVRGTTSSASAEAPQDFPTHKEAIRIAAAVHESIHATLHTVHHEYYRKDQGLAIPAATLKDVFEHLEEDQQLKLRWLVVDGQAMNTDHVAQSPFEQNAVKELRGGKKFVDTIENGVYRRAGAIKLTNVCLKCHLPNRKDTLDKTAGLIISIPIDAR